MLITRIINSRNYKKQSFVSKADIDYILGKLIIDYEGKVRLEQKPRYIC